MPGTEWKLGDRVLHASRPEWGIGEVRGVDAVVQDGVKSQRLTIRFDRVGVKTLSTAFAELEAAPQGASPTAQANGEANGGWLAEAEAAGSELKLAELPESATDPFKTRKARLDATLGLYRFTGVGASLIDWAAMQSGLKDPLSRFSRHELEQLWDRFRNNLDAHLKRLVWEMKKADPTGLAQAVAAASPNAKQALRRVDAGR
jgi:hypothetical protein